MLTDATLVWLRRAGLAGEESAGGQAELSRRRDGVKLHVQKLHELTLLRDLLQEVTSAAVSGELEPMQNFESWLRDHGQALEAREENRNKLKQRLERALQQFEDACWV